MDRVLPVVGGQGQQQGGDYLTAMEAGAEAGERVARLR